MREELEDSGKDSDADGEPMANLNTKRLQYQIRGVGR